MWIGGLALAGIPPFAGFFSKDQILADAMHVGGVVGWIVWSLGLLGAFVTSILNLGASNRPCRTPQSQALMNASMIPSASPRTRQSAPE